MSVTNITIIGLGLIGGSLGLAFKDGAGTRVKVTGVDHDQDSLMSALHQGVVDESTDDLIKGVEQADIIFLCVPVLQIMTVVEKMLPYVKPGVILTDVGSTKGFLGTQLAKILPTTVQYVSGHPMAGGEQSGIRAAHKDLFRDKWYILVPEASTSLAGVERISQILTWTGARLTNMNVVDHDQCAAIISHVPHIAAAALVNLLAVYPDLEDNFKLVGGGFRDTTRIASSNADMWADICLTNPVPIINSLGQLQNLLNEVIEGVKIGDRQVIHQFFTKSKIRRDALIQKTDSHAFL